MPNANLKDRTYNHNGEEVTYTTLAMRESRLNKAKEKCQLNQDCSEFNSLGGEAELKKIETIIHKEQDVDHTKKKVGMDAGRENQFIKTHTKDKDNTNVTKVGGIPKVNKGSVNRKIMSNKEVYNESFIKEIQEIKYLIEYMNNTKNKI
jgi:hypothetical protein